MQELTFKQVEMVSGGLTGEGQIFSKTNIAAATRLVTGVGLLYGAFKVGYAAGEWLNENTPIQELIESAIS